MDVLVFGEINKDVYSTEMEVFATGTHNGDKYTKKDLNAMIEAFNTLKNKWKPTLKIGHGKQLGEQPALGYVEKLRRAGTKLIARVVNIPKIVKKAIEKGLYKTRSAEIYWDYKDGKKTWPRCLKAIALLGENIPAVDSLKDIEKFFDEGEGDIKNYEMGFDPDISDGVDNYAIDHKGKKNPNWKDGRSPDYYRRYLSDHPICEHCKTAKSTMVHHKDGNRKNGKSENFMATCYSCHMKLENGQWKKSGDDSEYKEVKNYLYWSETQSTIKAKVRTADLFVFSTLHRIEFKEKEGVSMVIGALSEKPDDASIVQCWEFDRNLWTLAKSRNWLEGFSYESIPGITKTEDGIEFPKEAYLCIPDSGKSSTWKLRTWEDLTKKVTSLQLNKITIHEVGELTSEEMKGVKSKLKTLYKEIGVKDNEMPKYLSKGKEDRNMESDVKIKELEKTIEELTQKITKFESAEKTKEADELKIQLATANEELGKMKVFKAEADKMKKEVADANLKADAASKRADDVQEERRNDGISTFVKDQGVNGTKRILPKDEKLVTEILKSCPQEKKYKLEGEEDEISLEDMVKKFVEGLPALVDLKEHSKKDEEEGEFDTAGAELESEIAKYQEKNPDKTYTESYDWILKTNEDLKKRLHEEKMGIVK